MSELKNVYESEELRAAAILAAVNVESAFKLYAYRIYSHEYFVELMMDNVKTLNKVYTEELKKRKL